MRRTIKKAHMWLGLILAIFILLEAVTGLIMVEPWVIGESAQVHADGGSHPYIAEIGSGATGGTEPSSVESESSASSSVENKMERRPDTDREGFSAAGLVRMLHQGRIGGLDLGFILDILAVGLVILTVTGIYLAIPLLRPPGSRRE